MTSQPTEETTATPEEQAAKIAGAVQWLAALLGAEAMPAGYTVAVFHEDGIGTPFEYFEWDGRPIDSDNAALLLASIQYSILYHQVAHHAGKASDEEWAAAIARVTELGDYDGELTAGKMQEGRDRIQAARSSLPDALRAALAGSLGEDGPAVRVITGPDDLRRALAELGAPDAIVSLGEDEPETARGEAISHL